MIISLYFRRHADFLLLCRRREPRLISFSRSASLISLDITFTHVTNFRYHAFQAIEAAASNITRDIFADTILPLFDMKMPRQIQLKKQIDTQRPPPRHDYAAAPIADS